MPPVSGSVRALRESGWRQGRFARHCDHRTLLDGSADRVPVSVPTPFRLVMVTQDCDLVREPDIEPWVELILCREVAKVEPLYLNGRNPRLLHLQPICSQEPAPWLEISIHDRFRIAKEKLTGLSADETVRLEADAVRLLSRWIAKRYTRPAFPDAFNRRLATGGPAIGKAVQELGRPGCHGNIP